MTLLNFSRICCSTIFLIVCVSSLPSFKYGDIPHQGECVMHGHCEGVYGTTPCTYRGPPKPLDKTISKDTDPVELLKELCPDFVLDDDPRVCCTTDQLMAFRGQMAMIESFGFARCPSCLQNFRQLVCHLTCSPTQSSYLNVTSSYEYEEGENVVEEVNYYVSKKYIDVMFDSCKDLQGITPGSLLMDLICGPWTSADCSPERWTEFIGSTPVEGGYSPFRVNYIPTTVDVYTEDGLTFYPMNVPVFQCSESPGPRYGRCSCDDCKGSCPIEITEPPFIQRAETSNQSFINQIIAKRVKQEMGKMKRSDENTRSAASQTS